MTTAPAPAPVIPIRVGGKARVRRDHPGRLAGEVGRVVRVDDGDCEFARDERGKLADRGLVAWTVWMTFPGRVARDGVAYPVGFFPHELVFLEG